MTFKGSTAAAALGHDHNQNSAVTSQHNSARRAGRTQLLRVTLTRADSPAIKWAHVGAMTLLRLSSPPPVERIKVRGRGSSEERKVVRSSLIVHVFIPCLPLINFASVACRRSASKR